MVGDWTGISEWFKDLRGKKKDDDDKINQIIDGIEDTIGLIE
jgi:hypothetical protein